MLNLISPLLARGSAQHQISRDWQDTGRSLLALTLADNVSTTLIEPHLAHYVYFGRSAVDVYHLKSCLYLVYTELSDDEVLV